MSHFNLGIVNFPAVRNKMHTHSSDQVLFVTAGTGIIVPRRRRRKSPVGDVVHITADEHWHGQTTFRLSHIALTAKGSTTTQFNPRRAGPNRVAPAAHGVVPSTFCAGSTNRRRARSPRSRNTGVTRGHARPQPCPHVPGVPEDRSWRICTVPAFAPRGLVTSRACVPETARRPRGEFCCRRRDAAARASGSRRSASALVAPGG
jgi:hypothetical protein